MQFLETEIPYSFEQVKEAIEASWDWDTAYDLPPLENEGQLKGKPHNQCFVTALVLKDFFGGEILTTSNYTHYWNLLADGKEVDLTRHQFEEFNPEKIEVLPDPSVKFKTTTFKRYKILKKKVETALQCTEYNQEV